MLVLGVVPQGIKTKASKANGSQDVAKSQQQDESDHANKHPLFSGELLVGVLFRLSNSITNCSVAALAFT